MNLCRQTDVRRATLWMVLCFGLVACGAATAEPGSGAAGLSDPFVGPKGKRITRPEQWPAQRAYLKSLMSKHQYGHMPTSSPEIQVIDRETSSYLNGAAIRETFGLVLRRGGKSVTVGVGLVRPSRAGRFPVVIKNDAWLFDLSEIEDPDTAALYINGKRDQVDLAVYREAIWRGYAICKFNRLDVAADQPDNRGSGVFPLYPENDWGTLAAWAWAYQPIIDVLSREDWLDTEKIVSTGHSRGGKTALCAAIYDERITVAAPSASGSGGTGSWRFFEPGGAEQDVAHMARRHPEWFGPGLVTLAEKSEAIPVDGHTAKALIAPRGLFNTHGRDDTLANPLGTQATFEAAQVVFEWLGVPENQGLHWRPGGHGQTEEDWMALFDFCDRYFFAKSTNRDLQQMPHPGQPKYFTWRAPAG